MNYLLFLGIMIALTILVLITGLFIKKKKLANIWARIFEIFIILDFIYIIYLILIKIL